MNRRGFLGMFGGVVAALTLDPEKALWVPGKKLISIPKPPMCISVRLVIANQGAFLHSIQPRLDDKFLFPAGGRIAFEIVDLSLLGLYARGGCA